MISPFWFLIGLSWCVLIGTFVAVGTIVLVAKARGRDDRPRAGVLDDPRSARRVLVVASIVGGAVVAVITLVAAVALSIWVAFTIAGP